ncbi:hypothetical protein Hdeb2414_s0015g00448471 [Helianthus debilis subsp. tardiflorus]
MTKEKLYFTWLKHHHAIIYNLLYEIGARRDLVTLVKDKKGNSMLHMVAKKAKGNQFQNVAGVALQMQQDLLWFKVTFSQTYVSSYLFSPVHKTNLDVKK